MRIVRIEVTRYWARF